MLAQDYTKAVQDGLDAQTDVGPQPCTAFSMPNYEKIPELEVRQALAFAYPYEDAWSAAGELPGVTLANGVTDPELGFGLLPPGMAGREAWNPEIDGETIQYDPEHAKELLAKAGFKPGEFEASWVYDSSSPEGKAAMEQVKLGLREVRLQPQAVPLRRRQPLRRLDRPGQRALQEDQHPRHRVVPGLAVGRDLPPGHRRHGRPATTPVPFSEPSVDAEIERIQTEVPIEEQADAWGALEQKVMTDYHAGHQPSATARSSRASAPASVASPTTPRWEVRPTTATSS